MTKRIKRPRKSTFSRKPSGNYRAVIIEEAQALFSRSFDVEKSRGHCLQWTLCVLDVAGRAGVKLVPQAGTAQWQRLPDSMDDGAATTLTHFGYNWQGDELTRPEDALMHLDPDGSTIALPEMHIWAGDAHTNEIVDLSAPYIPEACEEGGMEWHMPIPEVIWAHHHKGARYIPNRQATELAVQLMMAEIPKLQRR
jgi:hypothetical protein